MPRARKPWFRKGRNAWYVEIGGTQHKLVDGPNDAETKARADEEFHLLMAECLASPPVDGGDPTVASIIDEFLEYSITCDGRTSAGMERFPQ